jgi:ubiquinone/menaquinone biosynthesis C-methylase UbiE
MKVLDKFKALADETRMRLFHLLSTYELNVNEITEILYMGQSRISRHLKILSDCGLLTCRRDGLWSFYSVPRGTHVIPFIKLVQEVMGGETILKEDNLFARKVMRERKDQTKAFFDSIASHWEYLKKELFGDIDLIRHLMEIIPSCGTIADLGCGTGDLLSALLDKADKVIEVDNSPKMLEEVRKRFHRNEERVDVRLGEMAHLPLLDGEVDCAIIAMVLHHLHKPYKAVREASRVLRAGSMLVIMDFEKHTNEMLRRWFSDRWLGFKKEVLLSFLKDAGLKPTNVLQIPVLKKLVVNIVTGTKSPDKSTGGR